MRRGPNRRTVANPSMDEKKIRDTLKALKNADWLKPKAAAALGIPLSTLTYRVRAMRNSGIEVPNWEPTRTPGKYEPQQYRDHLSQKHQKQERADLERQLYVAQEKIRAYEFLEDHAEVTRINPPPRGGKKRQAAALVLISDLHPEEPVEPAKVNGKNEFNLRIAKRRMDKLWEGLIWKTRHHMNSYDIRRMIACLGGDMATGFIHPELVESNLLPPMQALAWWVEEVESGLRLLLRVFPDMEFDLPCVVGNHGRTTDKIRVATRVENNFEWGGYWFLKKRFENEKRIRFHIAAGLHAYFEVWDWRFRLTHGDDVRYQGGVGGLSIPLRKATDAWSEAIKADVTLLGHWHQHQDFGFAVVNGSLIGYSPFALWVKARWEPPSQTFMLVDRERGKDAVSQIWVDDTQGRRG